MYGSNSRLLKKKSWRTAGTGGSKKIFEAVREIDPQILRSLKLAQNEAFSQFRGIWRSLKGTE
jgi:hypothetical protein